jgi:hypothetical protein
MYNLLIIGFIIYIVFKLNKKIIRKFCMKLSYSKELSEPLLDIENQKESDSDFSKIENPKIILYNNKFETKDNVGYYLYDDINDEVNFQP